MIGWSEVLWGGILPGTLAALVLATVWQATNKAASAWRTALVIGYLAGHWALDARTIGLTAAIVKSYQPTEARDWLPLLALFAIVPDALACVNRVGPVSGWILRIAICVFVPWRLLHGSIHLPIHVPGLELDLGGWSTNEAATWIGGIACAILVCWQLARTAAQEDGASVQSALATIVALGGTVTAALSSSIVYGQQFGVLAATLAGCGLSSALATTKRGPKAAAGPLVVLSGSLLTISHFYAELKLHNGLLLLGAMALAIGWLPLPAKLPPALQATCRSILCLVAISAAIVLAGMDYAETQADTESNPYQSFQP